MTFSKTLLLACLVALSPIAFGQEKPKPQDPFQHPFANPVDVKGLPRVLILGDSISMGYTPTVRRLFKEKANVHRPTTNCRWASFGDEHIEEWVGDSKWDVIHFNFGLWDWYGWSQDVKATPESYGKSLDSIVTKLKKTKAKLIFAVTTPPCLGPEKKVKFVVSEERARAFNEAALAVMKKHDVEINDLYKVIGSKRSKYQRGEDDVHYTDEGRALLADHVASAIEGALASVEKPGPQAGSDSSPKKPNIIYLMLDEWGYFESGHMGNKDLITPNIDQFAREGMRFTNAMAGAPVCGPTRCVLLTGLHSGHTSMRANDGFSPIRKEEPTLGSMLKTQGYATGGFGKWGIGGRGTSGVPEKHGFDEFFGYYDQVHAHTFYPRYLIRNSEEVYLKGNDGTSFYEGETHAQDEIFKASLRFIKRNKDNPFFCYLPWTPPHGLWGIDNDDPSWKLFADKPWKAGQKTENDAKVYAAFMHMIDRQIGEIIALLKEHDLDENTVFFLCGDNGGQDYFHTTERPHGFFGPNLNPATGERFRAGKGSLYEGGLRVPFLARWPGKIKAGAVSDHLLYFPDVMPTLAELSEAECPKTDGLSFVPTLMKTGRQKEHEFFYWEYQGQTAIRMESWKAYRKGSGAWELYDLSQDIEEADNVAASHPDILKRLVAKAEAAHEPMRPGEIYDRELTDKDHRQAPHGRNQKKH